MKTKGLLLAGVAIAVLPMGASNAADLPARMPTKAPPPLAATPFSWTGFYAGANIGIARARSSVADDPNTSFPYLLGNSYDNNRTGIIGGLQAGYNWQISSLVLGAEGDISFASLDHDVTVGGFNGPSSGTFSSRLSTLGTLRGRVGLAFDRLLAYGTGGVAFTNLSDQLTAVFPFTASAGSNKTGWTAGGGIEYAFADHWTVKAEYLHVWFGDRTATATAPTGYIFDFKDSLDIGRVGINYKF